MLLQALIPRIGRIEGAIGVEAAWAALSDLHSWVVLVNRKPHILIHIHLAAEIANASGAVFACVDRHKSLVWRLAKLTLIKFANTNGRIKVHPNICIFLEMLFYLGPMLAV